MLTLDTLQQERAGQIEGLLYGELLAGHQDNADDYYYDDD